MKALNSELEVALLRRLQQEHAGETYTVTSITVRLLEDGHLSAKAYGRRADGRAAAYVGLPFVPTPELEALVDEGVRSAAQRWLDHQGFGPPRRG